MRLVLAAAVIALLVVLGAGLLPPVFAQGSLDDATLAAARAGSSVLQDGGTASAEAAKGRSRRSAGPYAELERSVRIRRGGFTTRPARMHDVQTFR